MIILLLICYFFNGLMVSTIHGAINFKSKPTICGVDLTDETIYKLDLVKDLPPECEVFIHTGVIADSEAIICDTDLLKELVATTRPVLLAITRNYEGWVEVLKPQSDVAFAKAVTDYVTANGCAGVLLEGMSPSSPPKDTSIGESIQAFITHLKIKPDFYVGMTLCQDYPNELVDPKAFNYEDLNKLVDFFSINTYRLNADCKADLFNGITPITGKKDLVGMDSLVATLHNNTIIIDKSYLVEELLALNPDSELRDKNIAIPYGEVCDEAKDVKTWCAPTTKDYYDKAKFIKDSNYGLYVKFVEYDDSKNNCLCGAFIGFQNIVAGYSGKAHKPCAKFDRKNPAA